MRLEGCASRTPHGIVKFTEGLHRSVRGRQGFLSTRRLDNSRNPPLGRGTVVADARTRRPCLTNLTAGLKCSKTVLCSDLVPQGVPVLPHSPTAAVGCQAFPTGFKPLSQVKCVKVKGASRVPNTGIKAHDTRHAGTYCMTPSSRYASSASSIMKTIPKRALQAMRVPPGTSRRHA